MNLMRLVRGLVALAVLAALLAGAPATLWAVGRPFLPTRLPTVDDVTAALVRPDDGTLLVGLLVIVGWGVWATLAASVIREVVDQARNSGRARRTAPLALWPSRAVAALLVGWIVTAFATPPATVTAPAATTATEPLVHASVHSLEPDDTAEQHRREHIVAARDTLWDIAAAELGDPLRWREILDLNRGHRQPDGRRLGDDTVLHVGWTLALPDQAVPDRVVVHRGDTLSGLANRYLGAADRYPELYENNTGLLQPDGRRLADPDLIRPGWLLRIPDTTTTGAAPDTDTDTDVAPDSAVTPRPGAGPNTTPRPPSTPATETTPVPRPSVAPDDPPHPVGPLSPGTLAPPPTPAPHSAPLTPSTTPPSAPAPPGTATAPLAGTAPATPSVPPATAVAPPATVSPTSPEPHAVDLPGPVVLGTAGMLASGLLAGLLVLRRRQLRWRRHGRRIALPDATLSPVEAGLAIAAQPAGPLFLDLALRSLTAVTPGRYPELRAVQLAPTGVDLMLVEPKPPTPPYLDASDEDGGDGRGEGAVWRVGADAQLPLTEATAVGVANPYPALASLGQHGDGTMFLLDLEHAGALHLTGEPDQAVDLLRHIAVELGTARWADATTVLTVGLGPDLTELPGHRVNHVADLPSALAQLRAAMTNTADHLHHAGDTPLLDLRVRDQLNEAWLPTVLLIAHSHEFTAGELGADETGTAGLAVLCTDLADGGRCAAAVVTAGFPLQLDGMQVDIDPNGTTAGLGHEGDRLLVEQLPAPLAQDVLAIIGVAAAPDEPVPPAERSDPWADGMDEDGSVRGWEITNPRDESPQQNAPQYDDPLQAEPEAEPAVDVAEPVEEVSAPRHERAAVLSEPGNVDPMAARRLLLVEQQDPRLDDDLTLWHTETTPPRPLVGILGPPQLRAPGTAPDKRQSWFLEVVLYLALHPHGVDRDKLMTDLWPEGVAVQPATIRRAVAEARAWTGRDTTTDPPVDFIPPISPAGGDRYRLTGHLTDWDLFRRLRKRAQARTAANRLAGAVADYTAALALVRGPVLHPLRSRGYAWLHNPDQRHADLIPGYIIDAAHELVDLILTRTALNNSGAENGDLETARAAATTAQTVDPDRTSDRPFTDLMRIAHAAGDLDEMRTHAELLLAERDFEVGEDLPPESFNVFNELFPHGLRARAS